MELTFATTVGEMGTTDTMYPGETASSLSTHDEETVLLDRPKTGTSISDSKIMNGLKFDRIRDAFLELLLNDEGLLRTTIEQAFPREVDALHDQYPGRDLTEITRTMTKNLRRIALVDVKRAVEALIQLTAEDCRRAFAQLLMDDQEVARFIMQDQTLARIRAHLDELPHAPLDIIIAIEANSTLPNTEERVA